MPKGLRTLLLSFKDTHLTHFGGMVLLQRFCSKLRLRWCIQNSVKIPQRNAAYLPSDLILALLYAIMAGLRRINKTEILQYNGAFLSLQGLSRFPDQSTLRRFLKRLPLKAIRQLVALHDQLRERLFRLPKPRTTFIFDLDSVVLTIYGKLQFARVGYNPKKKGRRSYHPLLCFEAHLQEFWHGSLRPGNAASSTGAVPFLKRCLAKVPKQIARARIRIRADSGFFGRRVIEFFDSIGCGYVIVAKEYSTIKSQARGCRFKKLGNGWEVGEFRYQPHRWKCPHRFVVVRRPIPEDPIEAKQLTLFKDRKCAYHVLVTNLKVHPFRVWQFYAKRATIEKKYPRVALRLLSGKDSHRGLGRQCGLLPDTSVGLQPRALVQETLPPQRVSLCHSGHDPNRFPGPAGQAHQKGKSKCTLPSPGLSLQGTVPGRPQETGETQDPLNSLVLLIPNRSNIHIFKDFLTCNTLFTHY